MACNCSRPDRNCAECHKQNFCLDPKDITLLNSLETCQSCGTVFNKIIVLQEVSLAGAKFIYCPNPHCKHKIEIKKIFE